MRQLIISKSITNRDQNSLDKYFNEIDKIRLLSADEEVKLAQRVREGDCMALNKLVTANLRFVISVAKQYQSQGLSLGDLICEGNTGLITAAKRYDETRGFKFISYAVWWIRQYIIKAIAEHSRMVRLPYNQISLQNLIYKANVYLEQLYGRTPSCEEISCYLDVPEPKIYNLMARAGGHVSIYESVGQDGEHILLEKLYSDEPVTDYSLDRESLVIEIKRSSVVLNNREKELLNLYFGIGGFSPMSLEEIGEKFNITKEHVGRLKEKALCKLRQSSFAPVLKSCLS